RGARHVRALPSGRQIGQGCVHNSAGALQARGLVHRRVLLALRGAVRVRSVKRRRLMSVGQTSRQEDDDYADGYLQITRNGVNRLLGISGVCSTATSVIAVLFSLAPLTAGAQPAGRMPRVGVLYVGSPSVPNWCDEGFRQGLAELGYVEGKSAFLEV